MEFKNIRRQNFLMVQWIGLHTFTAEGPGSIPGPYLGNYDLTSPMVQTRKGTLGESEYSSRGRVGGNHVPYKGSEIRPLLTF